MYIPSLAPLLALSQSILSSKPMQQQQPSYPGHVLYALNDGRFIPSPAFGVGSALYQKNATGDVLLAFKNGYRHIDNAAIYDNEQHVGTAIAQSGLKREELYITTKFDGELYEAGDDVRAAFDKSIRKLGVDYVDLYLIHFPKAAARDGIAHVWREFEKLQEEGLVKSIGVSNFGVEELTELLAAAKVVPAVNQIRYHAYNALASAPLVALCKTHGIVLEAYSALTPLTRLPGGKAVPVAEKVAKRLGSEVGQAILDWLRTKDIVAVTTSSKDSRQKEQLAVFQPDFPPWTAEEVAEFESAAPGWEGDK